MTERTEVTDRVEALLREAGVEFRLYSHAPVFTSAEAARVRGTTPEEGAKALVMRADDQFYLVVISGVLRVDNKALRPGDRPPPLSAARPKRGSPASGRTGYGLRGRKSCFSSPAVVRERFLRWETCSTCPCSWTSRCAGAHRCRSTRGATPGR
jgi:hypothetical protein